MKYLIDKNNKVITTADDEYEFMLIPLLTEFSESKIVSEIPRPIVKAADTQPTTTGTITV